MSTTLTLNDHIAALKVAGNQLIDAAVAAGEDALVTTCPGWNIRALLAHQAMVHRWATAEITGGDPATVPNQTEIRRSVEDINSYYTDGLERLLHALAAAPADLRAAVFLNDAPAPREFWARRQAHETTIHGVDALSATLNRIPTTDEAGIGREIALDGIDELLAGFFTRGNSKLFNGEPFGIVVKPADSDRRWHVRVTETLIIDPQPATRPSLTIGGPAAGIYLGLWNRGDELTLVGDEAIMDRWRTAQNIQWRG